MLTLRYEGMTVLQLGVRYGKDHTTITHHCRKYGVAPHEIGMLADIEFVVVMQKQYEFRALTMDDPIERRSKRLPRMSTPPVVAKDKYADVFDPPVRKSKCYKDYLKEAQSRPVEKHYFEECHLSREYQP